MKKAPLRLRPSAVWLAGAICVLFAATALLAPWIAPYDPLGGAVEQRLMPPAWEEGGSRHHLLGTDGLGRDVLSRLVHGARISLAVCALALLAAGVLGSLLGMLAGYLGGWVDTLIMRLVDLAVSLPVILLALLFGVLFGPSLANLILIIVLVLWSQFARMARGETLRVRSSDYIDLARAAGCSSASILLRHVLPNVSGALIVLATLQVGVVVVLEASLSFLGVGVPPPAPAWGSMIADGRSYVVSAWWLAVVPGLAIMSLVLAANVLGDALADRLNPAVRRELGGGA